MQSECNYTFVENIGTYTPKLGHSNLESVENCIKRSGYVFGYDGSDVGIASGNWLRSIRVQL